MKKRIVGILLVLLLVQLVYSADKFTIKETEKISIETNANDPDGDKTTTSYSPPLNQSGEWQTTYGDAGEYKSSVTVSDGESSASKEILITVQRKDEPPKIEITKPTESKISINEAESVNFKVSATDLNKDELSYNWKVDGKTVAGGKDFTYEPGYQDSGSHKIEVTVSDGKLKSSFEWEAGVADVNIDSIVDSIQNIEISETEIASLSLPDFSQYGLTYTILSGVFADKSEWQTGYDDSGLYLTKIKLEGKGYEKTKTVELRVTNLDRPPVMEPLESKFINENEELEINLKANDPDGDRITYSAEGLPQGAEFDGSRLTWEPDFDTVKREGFVDWIVSKFGPLTKTFYVQFSASSKEVKVVQNAIITVKDENRPPVMEEMDDLKISEGQSLELNPVAYDLDGDKIKLSYSGLTDKKTYKADFDKAGKYQETVTASDGMSQVSENLEIEILNTNRAPVFEKIRKITASEGDSIAVILKASDPDGDEVTFDVENLPDGAYIKEGVFYWKVPSEFSSKGRIKILNLVFVARDKESFANQVVVAEIKDVNTKPRIINATKTVTARLNQPVLMVVDAVDDDGDNLEYTWNFGFLDTYKGTKSHLRKFTTKGPKRVVVQVSDGMETTEQIINVNII